MDNKDLLEAINQVMPYGKYKGRQLLDLPEPYLVWYHSKGFPQGKLGTQSSAKGAGLTRFTTFRCRHRPSPAMVDCSGYGFELTAKLSTAGS